MKRMIPKIVLAAVLVAAVGGIVYVALFYHWCPYGSSLQIARNTGREAEGGAYAQPDQRGVQKQMRGPGRHFIHPYTYSVSKVQDVVVRPGQIATVKSNVGKSLPQGRFLAGPDNR